MPDMLESFVLGALKNGNPDAVSQDVSGEFYLDGNMVNVELSNTIAEALYIQEIFRDGQSVTSKYTSDRNAGAVRVMLQTALPSTSRTLAFGGKKGTRGNGGVINVNPPMLPSNTEFLVYLNQINDQSLIFPDVSKDLVPLDVMAKQIVGYSKSVVQDRSASTLAEILAYSIFRSMNGGENVYNMADTKADDAYADMCNNLSAKFSNGDIAQGVYSFPTDGRTIIGRPQFVNGVFNRRSGIILNGSDLAQEMLKNYDLNARMSDKDYVGTGYKGYALGFHWQEAPDWVWTLVERYLELEPGSLDNVYAVAVSFESTAVGKVLDLGVKLIDANEVRGLKAQPLNIWGHESFRKSFIIGDANVSNDMFQNMGFEDDIRVYPIAPSDVKNANCDYIEVPVMGTDGSVVGYKQIAKIAKPNGGNIASGAKSVVAPVANVPSGKVTSSTSVTLTCATAGAKIYYTTDGKDPTSASTEYSSEITVSAKTTLKAIAVKEGYAPSPIVVYNYTV